MSTKPGEVQTDLSALELVYGWADGLYVKCGFDDRTKTLLVIVGALSSGEKVLIACESGERESKSAWGAILRDLRARGLKLPACLVADGYLGIWGALAEQAPSTAEQRCWNHKIVNVLDHFAKKDQAEAAAMLKKMMYAPTRSHCERHRRVFALRYRKTHPKAVATLERDWDRMVMYYGFPRALWIHLRTTNIVESPFNTVRLRTEASRRFKRVENAEAMVWKLLTVAEKSWRKLNAPGIARGGLRRTAIQRWSCREDEQRGNEERRLKEFTHLLTMAPVLLRIFPAIGGIVKQSLAESPRVLRRLQPLREWSHEKIKQVFT